MIIVAPLTGAWIETFVMHFYSFPGWPSHPSRVRGLKLIKGGKADGKYESHPSRVRGLKLVGPPSRFVLVSRTPHGCVD